MRNRGLQARQTAAGASSEASIAQPTITLALSATFTPAASCTSNKLTILPPPGYFMWANEPVPFEGRTITNCYPPEFLASYTSTTSGVFVSSIVPVMSPLVCPANFCTVRATDDNYIACCPSGYSFADPATPSIRDRPYYGGTCYSEFTLSQTVTVTKYDAEGRTNIEPWVATTTTDQAFAHPIDGFAPTFPRLGCPAGASSPSSSSSASSTATLSSSRSTSSIAGANPSRKSNKVSGGTIAGAVVGAIVGLVAIVAIILFVLRRRRQKQPGSNSEIHQVNPEIHQVADDFARYHYEKDSQTAAAEIGTSARTYELDSQPAQGSQPVHEMPSPEPSMTEQGKR
ncbi:hypothetical protein NX059_009042 [Plenodomus lindquistii]|nr:hypothetical protein NX059_009042 [Plenodomus lindquistii]